MMPAVTAHVTMKAGASPITMLMVSAVCVLRALLVCSVRSRESSATQVLHYPLTVDIKSYNICKVLEMTVNYMFWHEKLLLFSINMPIIVINNTLCCLFSDGREIQMSVLIL